VNRGAEQLLDLQRADDEVDRLAKEVAAVESALARDPELERARVAAEEAAAAQRDAELRVRALDGEVDSLRTRTRTVDRQLYGGSVRNPVELLTLQHELDALRAQVSEQEDATLAAMEDAEAAVAERERADAAVQALEKRRAEDEGPRTERLGRLRQQLADAVAARDALVGQVPEKSLALYRRIAQRHVPAVVRVVDGTCGGCHLPLGAHVSREARVGDSLVQCPNCDRILAP
jgi:predicted  nucleic acid-binding Zn-ribbon protein